MVAVIYAKILHRSFIPTIYENFKSVFFIYLGQTKIWKPECMLDLVIERIVAVLRYFHWIII